MARHVRGRLNRQRHEWPSAPPPPLPFLTEAQEAGRGVWTRWRTSGSCSAGAAARGGSHLHSFVPHGRWAAPRRCRQRDETRRQRRGNGDRTAVRQRISTHIPPVHTVSGCCDAPHRIVAGGARTAPIPPAVGPTATALGRGISVASVAIARGRQQVSAERLSARAGRSIPGSADLGARHQT